MAPLNACAKMVGTLKELECENGPSAEILQSSNAYFNVVQAKDVTAAATGARRASSARKKTKKKVA